MTAVDVVWEPFTDRCSRGFWDMAIVERLLAGRWRPPCWPDIVHHDGLATVPAGHGAVVVVPARHHANDVTALSDMLARLPWVLLILTGDEEGAFPVDQVAHPNMRIWVQTPQPDRDYPAGTRWLPNGPTPAAYEQPWGSRVRDVVFAGQAPHDHPRRLECVAAVQSVLDAGRTGALHPSAGFGQGLDQAEYLSLMASARVCPAPSGPVHVDSFRAWEALELGATPVLDMRTPSGRGDGYWPMVAAGAPVVSLSAWDGLPHVVSEACAAWPAPASRAAAWWMAKQRQMAYNLLADLAGLKAGISTEELL